MRVGLYVLAVHFQAGTVQNALRRIFVSGPSPPDIINYMLNPAELGLGDGGKLVNPLARGLLPSTRPTVLTPVRTCRPA